MNTLCLPRGDHELVCSSVVDFFLSINIAVGKLCVSCLLDEATRHFFQWLTKRCGLGGMGCLKALLLAQSYLLGAVKLRGAAAVFVLTWLSVSEGLSLQKHLVEYLVILSPASS